MLDLHEKMIWSRANLARPEFRLCSFTMVIIAAIRLGAPNLKILSLTLKLKLSSNANLSSSYSLRVR